MLVCVPVGGHLVYRTAHGRSHATCQPPPPSPILISQYGSLSQSIIARKRTRTWSRVRRLLMSHPRPLSNRPAKKIVACRACNEKRAQRWDRKYWLYRQEWLRCGGTHYFLKQEIFCCTVFCTMCIEGRRHSWRILIGNGGMGDTCDLRSANFFQFQHLMWIFVERYRF